MASRPCLGPRYSFVRVAVLLGIHARASRRPDRDGPKCPEWMRTAISTRALIWTAIAGSRFEHVPQGLHHLIGCRTPSLCLSIDLFERMNDISIVQSHIGL